MKFFVIALLASVALADQTPIDPEKKRIAMKIMTMDAKEMHHCMSDADCSNEQGKPKCCKTMRLCGPENMPKMDMTPMDCTGTDNSKCPPMHRCHNTKCHFTGPKGCDSDADCLQGVEGLMMECKEHAKSAPGKRCWAKCSADKDCHNCDGQDGKCRMPEELREKIGCCHGSCQKKMACQT